MSINNEIYYLCSKYSELAPDIGRERIHYTFYLVGWRTSLYQNSKISRLSWVYGKDGPFSEEINECINTDSRFKIKSHIFNGVTKDRIRLNTQEEINIDPFLSKEIDFIYSKTAYLNFMDLTTIVFSTYPLLVTNLGEKINMPLLAKKYSNQK